MPETATDEVLDQRRRLDSIATERAADNPLPDPAGWRRREADRASLEAAIASRIEQLITSASNAASRSKPRPASRPNRCCGCDRAIPTGHAIEKADGLCCGTCVFQTPAERALHRRIRAVPAEKLADYLDDLTDNEMSETFHLITGTAPRNAYDLRAAVHAAVRRRRRRSGSGQVDRQRRHLAAKVDNAAAAGTTSHATAATWADLTATLRPNLGPAAHLEHTATREVLDRVDDAELRDLRRLVSNVRDLTTEAVVVAEVRRRR